VAQWWGVFYNTFQASTILGAGPVMKEVFQHIMSYKGLKSDYGHFRRSRYPPVTSVLACIGEAREKFPHCHVWQWCITLSKKAIGTKAALSQFRNFKLLCHSPKRSYWLAVFLKA
jgi:hypothetical protein